MLVVRQLKSVMLWEHIINNVVVVVRSASQISPLKTELNITNTIFTNKIYPNSEPSLILPPLRRPQLPAGDDECGRPDLSAGLGGRV